MDALIQAWYACREVLWLSLWIGQHQDNCCAFVNVLLTCLSYCALISNIAAPLILLPECPKSSWVVYIFAWWRSRRSAVQVSLLHNIRELPPKPTPHPKCHPQSLAVGLLPPSFPRAPLNFSSMSQPPPKTQDPKEHGERQRSFSPH
jgi:hypothetical protein